MNFFKNLFKPKPANSKRERDIVIGYLDVALNDFKITNLGGSIVIIRRINFESYISVSNNIVFRSNGIQLFEVYDTDLLDLISFLLEKDKQYQQKLIDDRQEAELNNAIAELEKLRSKS